MTNNNHLLNILSKVDDITTECLITIRDSTVIASVT